MKILHVYKVYLPENFTGVPRVIHSICEGAARLGVESSVLALSPEAHDGPVRIGAHDVHLVRRDLHLASTGLSLAVFARFRELALGADLVHYHLPWPVADLLYLRSGQRKPSVVTYHSDVVRQKLMLPLYRPILHRLLSGVDAVVATSSNYAATSLELARHPSKVSVIPIGIPEAGPVDGALREAWRERLGSDFFLFVGAHRYYKGLDFLVEASRLCGLPVVVAGGADTRALTGNDCPPNLRFVGEVSEADKEALLSLSKAFVLPSHLRAEAFGVALLEAARRGKPMISCEIGTGTTYVNIGGVTGLAVPPADAEALAMAMKLLDGDRELANRMGRAARSRYEELFRDDVMASAYLDLYQRVLGSKPNQGIEAL